MLPLIPVITAIAINIVDDGSVLHTGEATFYGDGGGGNCGFPGAEQPLYHGAMNQIDYDSAAVCGAWVHIIGPKGEVTAFIDDRCPECKEGDIDLGPGTFEAIADRALGRAPIQWRYVAAPVTGPIRYFWQTGSSRWHIALQVRNHRYAIAGVDIATANSDWVPMVRSYDNYFVLAGGISSGAPGPFRLRVTDIFGHQLVDTGMVISEGTEAQGSANFETTEVHAVPKPGLPGAAHQDRSAAGNICISVNPVKVDNTGLYDIFTFAGARIGRGISAASVARLSEVLQGGIVVVKRQ